MESSKQEYREIVEKGLANMQADNFTSASLDFYKALDIAEKRGYSAYVV